MVLTRAKESYRLWHDYIVHLKRIDRYTIGEKIDKLFLELLENIFRATFAFDKFEKLSVVSQSLARNDSIKFFLQIAWEDKVIDHKIYGKLILSLDEVGRMLGGWKKSLQEKTPAKR